MSGIRLADIPDMQRIYELGLELLEASSYKGIKHDDQKFKTLVAGLMGSKKGRVLVVVDDNDVPQGFLLGVIDEYFFSQYRFATDLAVYIKQGFERYALRLYRMFIDWAKTKPKVMDITFAHSSGMGDFERWCRLMEKLGLTKNGSFYTMRVLLCQA